MTIRSTSSVAQFMGQIWDKHWPGKPNPNKIQMKGSSKQEAE